MNTMPTHTWAKVSSLTDNENGVKGADCFYAKCQRFHFNEACVACTVPLQTVAMKRQDETLRGLQQKLVVLHCSTYMHLLHGCGRVSCYY